MKHSFKSLVTSVVISSAALFGFSSTASAQLVFGALDADAGTFAPLTLGEDLELSACGSTFASGAGNFNLCDAPTITDISFSWTIANNTTSTFIALAGSAVLTLTTGGVADFINSVGSYSVFLNISAINNPINLGGGQQGLIFGNTFDNDFASFTVAAATVPEPESLFILLPGLFYIARRQRLRVAKASAKLV